MDDKTWLGGLAEFKVASELHKIGYYVYTQPSGKGPIDLIVLDESLIPLKVEVKGVSTLNKRGKLEVRIGSVRSNHTSHRVIKFNKDKADILGIYLEPLDKVYLLDAKKITTGRSLTFNEEGWRSLVYRSSLEKNRTNRTVSSNLTPSAITNNCLGCGRQKLTYQICCL